MAGLFAKAKAKKEKTTSKAKPKKATTWVVGDKASEKVAEAVAQMCSLSADAKAIAAKMKVHKAVVLPYAEGQFFSSYADIGVFPETPMVVQNGDGQKVTFVVQDRSQQYGVKDDQVEELVELLGEDAVEDLLYEETTIAFSREILAIEGVSEVIEAALERAINKMLKEGILDEEQAGELIDPVEKRTFKPGTLQRLAVICGKDTTKMEEFVDAMGSSCTRYIKA
jgi:hypothetical protein